MPKRSRKINAEQTEQTQEAPPQPPFRVDNYSPHKTRILYIIVSVFIIVLGVIWGWSIKQRLLTFQWSQSSEARMLSDAQKTWNDINKQQNEKDSAYADVRSNIRKLIQTALTATTTSSSATVVTSTTPTSTVPTSTAPTTTKIKK